MTLVCRMGQFSAYNTIVGPTYKLNEEHAHLVSILPHVMLVTRPSAGFGRRPMRHAMLSYALHLLTSLCFLRLDRHLCSISYFRGQ